MRYIEKVGSRKRSEVRQHFDTALGWLGVGLGYSGSNADEGAIGKPMNEVDKTGSDECTASPLARSDGLSSTWSRRACRSCLSRHQNSKASDGH